MLTVLLDLTQLKCNIQLHRGKDRNEGKKLFRFYSDTVDLCNFVMNNSGKLLKIGDVNTYRA